MSKIKKKFDNLKLENKKALIPFITAGFPNNNICQSIINKLPSMGADIIEIGMPFSDPMAEGPIIQTSSKLSIDMGHTMMKTFEIVKDFRRIDTNTPIVLMGYYNPIYRFGRDKFLQNCRELGVDGLIIVDLRARPPIGFFFQPQGSVSPFTFEVKTNLIVSCLEKFPNRIETVKSNSNNIYFVFILFPNYKNLIFYT